MEIVELEESPKNIIQNKEKVMEKESSKVGNEAKITITPIKSLEPTQHSASQAKESGLNKEKHKKTAAEF